MKSRFLCFTAISSTLLLAACASSDGHSGSWQTLGTLSDGNIKAAIDKSSIRKNGMLVSFRDRKTISKPSEERFTNTPPYKTALGSWEIHCANKTYRLTALKLISDRGQTVADEQYTATNLRPMSIMNGTVTEKQYELVCGKKL
ncbi:surface-adhesin E family protein [Bergeriella denitrificans]|uniref:Lipoprotein n=1 Tax=Bergeriella denitrificans TaxID=494 RepID=A0A378UIK8_BERDE|nr:surface-adhesin E family protein [Bergeriella denitrificans]STZ77177.1 lipoprotein [Bergeriella denitrificans]